MNIARAVNRWRTRRRWVRLHKRSHHVSYVLPVSPEGYDCSAYAERVLRQASD